MAHPRRSRPRPPDRGRGRSPRAAGRRQGLERVVIREPQEVAVGEQHLVAAMDQNPDRSRSTSAGQPISVPRSGRRARACAPRNGVTRAPARRTLRRRSAAEAARFATEAGTERPGDLAECRVLVEGEGGGGGAPPRPRGIRPETPRPVGEFRIPGRRGRRLGEIRCGCLRGRGLVAGRPVDGGWTASASEMASRRGNSGSVDSGGSASGRAPVSSRPPPGSAASAASGKVSESVRFGRLQRWGVSSRSVAWSVAPAPDASAPSWAAFVSPEGGAGATGSLAGTGLAAGTGAARRRPDGRLAGEAPAHPELGERPPPSAGELRHGRPAIEARSVGRLGGGRRARHRQAGPGGAGRAGERRVRAGRVAAEAKG